MSGVFSADGGTKTSGEGLGTWTVRLEVGAGLHNLTKVVTKDSRISTWTFSISFARRIDLRGAFDATLGRARFDSDPDNNGICTGKILLSSPAMQFEKPVIHKLVRIAGTGEEGQKSECGARRLPKD